MWGECCPDCSGGLFVCSSVVSAIAPSSSLRCVCVCAKEFRQALKALYDAHFGDSGLELKALLTKPKALDTIASKRGCAWIARGTLGKELVGVIYRGFPWKVFGTGDRCIHGGMGHGGQRRAIGQGFQRTLLAGCPSVCPDS